VSFKFNDRRRIEMAEAGFHVRMIVVDRLTHQVSVIKYTYDPRTDAEREADDEAEAAAYAKKASDGESLT
jgi:hypothetical protein